MAALAFYGRHEPSWMGHHTRELSPYFVDGPYVGFHEPHPFLQDEPYEFSPYAAPPFLEPGLARIPRTASAMPAFGHYTDSPFLEPLGRPGPLRSSSAIPTYAYSELPFHDLPRGPARSASSIPSFRESRPKQHKVAPEIELRVPMLSSNCEQRLKEALRKVPGVTEVVTDRRASKVTVSGKVDPQVVLKHAQKIKRKSDFWTKEIYSRAFIEFIQSKTGRAEPEPEVTSSYHQHAPSEEGDCHHAYEGSENLSSYEEYPGHSERDEHENNEMERASSHAPFEQDRGHYSQYNNVNRNYGQRSSSDMDNMPYGMPSASSTFGHVEESYGTVDDRPRYESPYYDHVQQPSFGERVPYYESYGDSSSYRPSQGYGPSGVSNPGYMKRVISDY